MSINIYESDPRVSLDSLFGCLTIYETPASGCHRPNMIICCLCPHKFNNLVSHCGALYFLDLPASTEWHRTHSIRQRWHFDYTWCFLWLIKYNQTKWNETASAKHNQQQYVDGEKYARFRYKMILQSQRNQLEPTMVRFVGMAGVTSNIRCVQFSYGVKCWATSLENIEMALSFRFGNDKIKIIMRRKKSVKCFW